MDGTETEGRRRSEIRLLLPRLLLMCLNFFFLFHLIGSWRVVVVVVVSAGSYG